MYSATLLTLSLEPDGHGGSLGGNREDLTHLAQAIEALLMECP